MHCQTKIYTGLENNFYMIQEENTPIKKKKHKSFGNGYRKPIKDEYGVLQCNCTNPKPTSLGDGKFYCMKCKANWYH